jgi:hypothetical protein
VTKDEIRKILLAYRSGEMEEEFFAEAMKEMQNYPDLARWFAEEQEFDRAFAGGIAAANVPAGLKTRILSQTRTTKFYRPVWPRRIALAAAAIIVLAVLFSSWRGLFVPNVSLADYRGEMVSFIKLTPPLELESANLERIQHWLGEREAPIAAGTPLGLAKLEPVGCRVLFFRGHKVTLICFRRGPAKLVHLFVVDRSALPKLPAATAPQFRQEGEWMTAGWHDSNHAYLLGVQGDRALLEHYLNGS